MAREMQPGTLAPEHIHSDEVIRETHAAEHAGDPRHASTVRPSLAMGDTVANTDTVNVLDRDDKPGR
jgi:hypothetical protein